MVHRQHHGVLLVAVLTGGCGTIVELPVDDASTSEDESTSGSDDGTEPDGTTGPGGSSGATSSNPDDDLPTSSTSTAEEDSGSSTTSVSMPMSIQICGDPGLGIPEDGTWAGAPIDVPSHAGVLDLDVAVRIQHPVISELRVRLRAPDGVTVLSLLDTPSCDGAGVDAMFDDGAGQSAEEACTAQEASAISGAVEPLDPLEPLLAEPVEGTWVLEVTDTTPGGTGSLDQACIFLTVEAR